MKWWAIQQALISHWVHRPLQFFTLLIGLSMATGLWTGVQAINTEARTSYQQARNKLIANTHDSLVRRDGKPITLATYSKLQQKGWRASPVLEGELQVNGRNLRVLGIDIVSMPEGMSRWSDSPNTFDLGSFVSPPYRILASAKTSKYMGKETGLPPVAVAAHVPEDALIMDIAAAARLLDKGEDISRLVMASEQNISRVPLDQVAPQLEQVVNRSAEDIDRLTDSFHLNLTAFGLLAFAVGLFIVQGTINLAFEQRRTMARTLRVLGLSVTALSVALVLELLIIALLAGALGVLLGYLIAAFLLPDVAATLRGLYGAQVPGELEFRIAWWATGLAIAVAGTFLAAFWSLNKLVRMPILAAARPRAWALMSYRSSYYRVLASFILLMVVGLCWGFGEGLVVAFAIVACFLLGSALLLPDVYSGLLYLFEQMARRPLSQWFWADTRQQLPGLALALMALLLALATNIGVSTMVGSFRLTFAGWLDQRLAAELYVRAKSDKQAVELHSWLQSRTDAVLPVWSVEAKIEDHSGRIFGFADHATYRDNWPMLELSTDAWQKVADGRAAIINEQLARRLGLSPGQMVDLAGHRLTIAGIYSDYGNPRPQAMVNVDLLTQWFPQVEKRRFALRVNPKLIPELTKEITKRFDLSEPSLVDQEKIKQRSVEVFERTFAVTHALNILTLAVAGFAIFTSLLTQSTMRLPQLAPIWALGLTRRQLAGLEFLRALLLAGLTMIFAIPLGVGLAWLLLAVVNVEAFGWRLPLFVFETDWVWLGLYGVLATALAAAIPARRFSTMAPAQLVRVFAHER